MGYTEDIIKWAESGTFAPNLIPDDESKRQLRALQAELYKYYKPDNPKVRRKRDLHGTVFYLKPKKVYEFIRDNVDPDAKPAYVYSDLSVAALALMAGHSPKIKTGVLEYFGSDEKPVVALTLEDNEFHDSTMLARAEIYRFLGRHGVSGEVWQKMSQLSDFKWLLSGSLAHITLLSNVSVGPIPSVKLPETLNFDKVSQGGVHLTDDPALERQWLTMSMLPGRGDEAK